VAAIIQRRAGMDLVDYLRPRLLDPLGIPPVSWESYPPGRSLGFSGLFTTTEAIAKLGQTYLDGGRWQGRQLLPAGWTEQVSTRWIDTPREPNPDWRQGYGFQVWHARHGYRGDGAFGQFCVILPEQDAVLATTLATEDMQAVLDAAWEHLLPAMADGPTDPAADQRLAERLAALALPVPDRTGEAPAGVEPTGSCTPSAPAAGPGLERVELLPGDGGLRVLLAGADGIPAEAAIGDGWTIGEAEGSPPIAVAGGWIAGRLRLSVLFLETPHRLELDLDPGTRTAALRWVRAPLTGPGLSGLGDLQAPRPLH
jgi:Beta-lactamase